MRELVDKAEAMTNPPGVSWLNVFTSRFVGALPAAITEVPRVLVLAPDTVVPEPGDSYSVTGFFEHSAEGTFANTGRVAGTLNPSTREFVLRKQGAGGQWIFAGMLSPNGQVMHLRLNYEGYTTNAFSLIREDAFAQLIPA